MLSNKFSLVFVLKSDHAKVCDGFLPVCCFLCLFLNDTPIVCDLAVFCYAAQCKGVQNAQNLNKTRYIECNCPEIVKKIEKCISLWCS